MKNKRYWFKRRRYGYGWFPATMEGYATVAIFLGLIIGAGFWLDANPSQGNQTVFFGVTLVSVTLLVLVSHIKGPKLRWRWGKAEGDNPEEDW